MHLAQLFSILVVASVAAGRTAPLYTARAGDKIEDSYFIILEVCIPFAACIYDENLSKSNSL